MILQGLEQNYICFFSPRFVLICCKRLILEMHHVLSSPSRIPQQILSTFINLRDLDKYILQFGQIHLAIKRKLFGNLNKYILQFGQIQLSILRNLLSNLDKYKVLGFPRGFLNKSCQLPSTSLKYKLTHFPSTKCLIFNLM